VTKVYGGGGVPYRVKLPRTHHSPPFRPQSKNGGAILPLPHTSSWCDNFNFTIKFSEETSCVNVEIVSYGVRKIYPNFIVRSLNPSNVSYTIRAEEGSNFLMVIASTVIPGSGPRWDPWPYFCSFQDKYVLKWDLVLEERRGWTFCDYFSIQPEDVISTLDISETVFGKPGTNSTLTRPMIRWVNASNHLYRAVSRK
jgi:hypothetical protein